MVFKNRCLLVLFILVVNGVCRAMPKLLLTVYYESNCPDSKSFILQQLRPAMRLLHGHVRTRFVPFGKAMSIDYGFGGFECQHGQRECYGNMVQDCTLNLMQGRTDQERLEYVACEMDSEAASKYSLECVAQAQVRPEKVQHCVEFGKGTMLQIDSEYLTSLVAPKFIPTITIDNVFDQHVQDAAQVDLIGTLCTFLMHSTACAQHYNRLAWQYIF
ncbi:GILT-like protein 1 [Pectinophora gossypiella]|nr:GILT-like protein 1 [Pectinophora gossypiella]